jgi:hypothetical protein
MTNAERRAQRREAGKKGAATRRARLAQAEPAHDPPGARPHQAEPDPFQQLADRIAASRPTEPPRPPRLETAEEASAKARCADEKRLANLRAVIRQAQEIRRESDLYHFAQAHRWPFSPKRWTAAQIEEARQFLAGFIRPDGTPQADPIRRKGRWRL